MEQPKVYNTEDELIKWLKYDLKEQRQEIVDRNEIFSGKKIPLKKVEEKDLTLNIGMKIEDISDDNKCDIKINFEFDLNNIMVKLFDKYYYEGIDCKINCIGLIFSKKVNFSNYKFKNEVLFRNSKFIDDANFSINLFNKDVNFHKASFNKDVNFSFTSFNKNIDFSFTSFNENVYFSDTSFNKNVNFHKASFNEGVNFSKIPFNGIVDFSYAKFHKNVDFSEAIFSIAEFLNSSFYINNDNNKIDFSNIIINGYLKLGNIDNIDNIKISDNTEIKFDNITFKDKKSYLSIINIKGYTNKLSLKDTTIDGRINIQNVEVETADFKGSVINGGLVNPVKFKVNNFANRESALFLKNEAYARHNVIDALEYKAKEIELYAKELKKELKNKKYDKSYKEYGDIWSIRLSSLYSDNGLNWIKSLFMTIFFTFIFFTIFYLPDIFHFNCIFNKLYWKDYLYRLCEYFIPTNYNHLIEYVKNVHVKIWIKIFGVIVYFTGKIMFWYGSVQTVQSFRKFSKGA